MDTNGTAHTVTQQMEIDFERDIPELFRTGDFQHLLSPYGYERLKNIVMTRMNIELTRVYEERLAVASSRDKSETATAAQND
jgi:hypothetical protein